MGAAMIGGLRRQLVVPSSLLGMMTGCFQPEKIQPEQLERGYIVMLPGVESGAWQLGGAVNGLRDAGVDQAIDIIEWGDRPFGSLRNLTNLQVNLQRAKAIAGRIAEHQAAHPRPPITLIGYSGGGGMADLTAEALPDGVMLDKVILIAAALDPDRDLSPVLAHCRHGAINFYSRRDWFTLGVGTTVFGTIDRRNISSAGRVGFREHGATSAAEGLMQIPWTPEWAKLGHGGGHIGWLSREWSKVILAPRIPASLAPS